MTDFEPEEDLPPVAHVTLVYNGPVAPHWEMKTRYGDQKMLDDFWTRVHARLLLLPKHDPQFRRNRERVNRDAERERIICDWDLGDDDAESTSTPTAMAPTVDQAPEAEPEGAAEEAAPAEAVAEEVAHDEAAHEVAHDEAAHEVAHDGAASEEAVAEEVVSEEEAADEAIAEDVAGEEAPAEDEGSDEPSEMSAGQA